MKTLFCFYDMAISPCSYDFFTFLYSAEACRLRRGLEDIQLFIVHGVDGLFRKDDLRTEIQNETFFNNVIIPGISILPSCKIFSFQPRNQINISNINKLNVFPRGYEPSRPTNDYTGRSLVPSKLRQDSIGALRAPEYAINLADEFVANQLSGQIYVTLTVREIDRDNKNHTRTLNKEIWNSAIEKLESEGIKTVIIRDTQNVFENTPVLEGGIEMPSASIHLPLRMAIYQKSLVNFCKNNGPGILQLFSDNNNMYFNEFDNEVTALSEDWFAYHYGMVPGAQFPMTRHCNIYKWGKEEVHLILEHVKSCMKSSTNKNINFSFNTQKNLIKTIETSISVLAHDIGFGVLPEDRKLYQVLNALNMKMSFTDNLNDLIIKSSSQQINQNTIESLCL